MYHICFSNPSAWKISYKNGIYGNVEKGNENLKVFWGKTIDLLALVPGDRIFFYVKTNMCLHGVFEVESEPYYCQDDLFDEDVEKYPFRFNFREVRHFTKAIPVSELAKLIENGSLYSINTFERDVNAQFRGIRQITNEEGKIIEDTFLMLNPKVNQNDLTQYEHRLISKSLEANTIINNVAEGIEYQKPVNILMSLLPVKKIRKDYYVALYENSLQGYIFYCIRRGLNNVIDDLEVNNFNECLMEVPMLKAQQFRSDILCLYRENNLKPHFYSIIETKKERKISIVDLSQLIGYMKTFSASKIIPFNSIEGVYISTGFEEEAITYLRNRKSVEKENPVRLIEYHVEDTGKVTFNQIEI